MHNTENFQKLVNVIEKLRSPEGCPWDREQTHKTLRENFLEEAYEAVDAIDEDNMDELKEELGDVLLQVILHSQIASEDSRFNINDVAGTITDKLIRRHPHVFGDVAVNGTDDVLANWEEIKKTEKPQRKSILSGISKSQPALMTAAKISKKVVKTGFEWSNIESLWDCIYSELDEFKKATQDNDFNEMENELGDILFSVVNLARWHKIDPELALIRANKKFTSRFQKMEELADKDLQDYSFAEYDDLWKTAKKELQS
jgi:tetrapyrrole methylase family protein/MazG family protein